MKRCGLLLLLLLWLPLCAEAVEIRFEAHTFMPDLRLDLESERINAPRSLDLKDALEIEDINTVIGKLYINDRIRLSYLDFAYEGKKSMLASDWGDLHVKSDLGLRYGGVGYLVPLHETERFRADLLVDVKAYTASGQLGAFFSETELLSTEHSRIYGVAPTLGLSMEGNVGAHLQLYGEVSALPLGSYGSFWEADAGLKYKVKDAAFVQIGYKSLHLVTKNQALETVLTTGMQGPYVGLNFDFR